MLRDLQNDDDSMSHQFPLTKMSTNNDNLMLVGSFIFFSKGIKESLEFFEVDFLMLPEKKL